MTWRSPLLDRPGAVAASGPDAGVAWHYGDPVAEQRALERGAAVVDQSHLAVISVTGADRLTWLNSLTSQDLTALPPRRSTETLLLTPQGRLEAAVCVVDDGETTWLITEVAQRESLTKWLDSMRFAMRVEVVDVTDRWAVLGEAIAAEGNDGEPVTWWDTWPEVRAGGTRYGVATEDHPGVERAWRLVLVPRDQLETEIFGREQAGWRLAGTWASEAIRIAAWRPRFAREVDERAIPHEVDWLRTAVHLHKGCYRGQETIARVHNLGKPPRRLVQLHLDGSVDTLPAPGSVVKLGAKTVGFVTSSARHHIEGPIALALIKRATALGEELMVEAIEASVATVEQGTEPVETAVAPTLVAATQVEVVSAEGLSVDRPAGHGPLLKGLPRTGMIGRP
ncbi:hypothetical protein SAMN06309944_1165 [Micrococcales bacterium KH10]|nr:hypothetical protein SAMN06309944_1165 [Micrococcales bacterium KH10]